MSEDEGPVTRAVLDVATITALKVLVGVIAVLTVVVAVGAVVHALGGAA